LLQFSNLCSNENVLQYMSSFVDGLAASYWDNGNLASQLGHLCLIESQTSRLKFSRDSLVLASSNGHLDVIKWLMNQKSFHQKDIAQGINSAGKHGNLELVEWLWNKNGEVSTYHLLDGAAIQGHFKIVEWLENNTKCGFSKFAIDCAAGNGHLDVIKFLLSNKNKGFTYLAVENAAERGHLKVLEFLYDISERQGMQMQRQAQGALDKAAENGFLDALKWLHSRNFQGCTSAAMDRSAAAGFLDMVEWLHYNRSEGGTCMAMDCAAKNGHFAVLLWLHQNRSEGCSYEAMDFAAENGHLHIVEWLHFHRTEGCSTNAMDTAAANGHLMTLEWLHQYRTEGCTSRAFCAAAAGTGYKEQTFLAVVEWLFSHFPVSEQIVAQSMEQAAISGNLAILEWLYLEHRALLTSSVFDHACAEGHLHVVEWLHRQVGSDPGGCTTWAMDGAAQNGHLQVLEWLHGNRQEGCTQYALRAAAQSGALEMVAWLHSHRPELAGPGSTTTTEEQRRQEEGGAVAQEQGAGEWKSTAVMDAAAISGHLKVVQWLHQNRSWEGCSSRAFYELAGKGNLGMMEWVYDHQLEVRSAAAMEAALSPAIQGGYLSVVEWLGGKGPEFLEGYHLAMAEAFGWDDVAEWLSRKMGLERLDGARRLSASSYQESLQC